MLLGPVQVRCAQLVVLAVHPEELVASVVHDDVTDRARAVDDGRPVGAIQVAALDLGARRLVHPEEKAMQRQINRIINLKSCS